MRSNIPALSQLLNFYKALSSYSAYLPRVNHPSIGLVNDVEEHSFPDNLCGIPLDKFVWETGGAIEVYYTLERALGNLASVLEEECKSRIMNSGHYDYVLEPVKRAALDVVKTYGEIKDFSCYALSSILSKHLSFRKKLCLGLGDDVDAILEAFMFVIGFVLTELFDEPDKILKYAQCIEKLESYPDSLGLNYIESMMESLEADAKTEKDE